MDRKHDPVAKAVGDPAVPEADQAGLFKLGGGKARCGQPVGQPLPALGRKANAEFRDGGGIKAAPFEVFPGCGTGVKLFNKPVLGQRQRLIEPVVLSGWGPPALARHLQPDKLCQLLDCGRKLQHVVVADKANGAAVGATAKAVIKTLVDADSKQNGATGQK